MSHEFDAKNNDPDLNAAFVEGRKDANPPVPEADPTTLQIAGAAVADLEQAIHIALGAASMAWDEGEVFMTEFVQEIAADLLAYIDANYEKKENKDA